MPAPKASGRQLSGSSLPKAPRIRLKDAAESPNPTSMPAPRCSIRGVVAYAITTSPSA